MKLCVALSFVASLLPSLACAQPDGAQIAQVKGAFQRYDDGRRTNDAQKILDVMAPDIDWTNDSGLRFAGKARVELFLKTLFCDRTFWPESPVR